MPLRHSNSLLHLGCLYDVNNNRETYLSCVPPHRTLNTLTHRQIHTTYRRCKCVQLIM